MPASPPRPAVLAVLFALLASAGCEALQKPQPDPDQPQAKIQKSRAEDLKLRDQLYAFSDHFAATVIDELDDIIAESDDLEIKSSLTKSKLRVIPAVNAIVAQPNPRVAALDLVTMLHRIRIFYESDAGREVNLVDDDRIITLVSDLEEDAWKIIRTYLGDEDYAALRQQVEEFCKQTQTKGVLSRERMDEHSDVRHLVRPDLERVQGTGFFSQVSSELTGTVAQLERMNELMERLNQQAEFAYTYARWAGEIFIYDMVRSDTGKKLLGDVDTMARSLDLLSSEVADLNGRLDVEIETVLDEVAQSREMLAESLEDVAALVEQAGPLLTQTKDLATTATDLTDRLTASADAWEKTAGKAETLLGALPKDASGQIDLNKVEALLVQATELSTQTEKLLDEVKLLTDPDALDSRVAKLEQTTNELIGRVDTSVHGAIRLAAMYGAGLIVLLLVGLFILRATRPRAA